MKKINWGLVVTAMFSLLLVAGIIYSSYNKYTSEKQADIAEMSNNNGVCKTYGCVFRSHDNEYETTQQAAWYDEHITKVHEQQRQAHLAWVASMEKRGYSIDNDVKHAYDN